MNTILRDGLDIFLLVFPDDILIYSCTNEEHKRHMHAVLSRLRAEKFFGRSIKVISLKQMLNVWDLMWERMGFKPSLLKAQIVAEWFVPTSIKHVQ